MKVRGPGLFRIFYIMATWPIIGFRKYHSHVFRMKSLERQRRALILSSIFSGIIVLIINRFVDSNWTYSSDSEVTKNLSIIPREVVFPNYVKKLHDLFASQNTFKSIRRISQGISNTKSTLLDSFAGRDITHMFFINSTKKLVQ